MKESNMKRLIGMVLFSLFLNILQGQDGGRTSTDASANLTEQVLLTTDRDLYLAGEDIYFSAIIRTHPDPQDLVLSQVLYVELYNSDYATIEKRKYRIVDNQVSGLFKIPTVIISDHYYLRAYTQYMRNFPPETFFNTRITIVNPEIPPQQTDKPIPAVLLMPDNNILINGLNTKVALKISPPLLKDVLGYSVQDKHGQILAEGTFLSNGLGLFELCPHDTLSYQLNLYLANGDSLVKPLPAVKDEGILMTARSEKNQLKINVHSIGTAPQKEGWKVQLTSENFCVQSERPLMFKEGKASTSIAGAALSKGLNYLVLMDAGNQIIMVKALFHPGEGAEKLAVETNQSSYAPREKIELTMDKSPSSYSLALVYKGTTDQLNDSPVFPPYLLGNPFLLDGYLDYQSTSDTLLQFQLDALLMLNYQLFNSNDFRKKLEEACAAKLDWLPETRDVSLSGMVIDEQSREALSGVTVFAAVLGESPQFHTFRTGADGQFHFSINQLYSAKDICICTSPSAGEAELLVYNDFSTNHIAINHLPLVVDSSLLVLLEDLWINNQTGRVFVEKNELSILTQKPPDFPFSDPQISIKLKDFIPLPTLYEVFNEIVPFVEAKKKKENYLLSVLSEDKKLSYDEPLILVDNLPVFDINNLMGIQPSKIEQIDVYNGNYTYGDLILKGLIVIQTNTDNFGGIDPPQHAVFVEYQTLTPQVRLQFPDYAGSEKQNRSPDFRNTLYWNPRLTTQRDTTVPIFAGDRRGAYELIVRGLSDDGRFSVGKKIITIE